LPIFEYARVFYHWRLKNNTRVPYVPEDISLEVTNVCNFRCKFCPQSLPSHQELAPKRFLSKEQAETIFRALRDGGVKTKTIHYTLDGEPFSNRKFHEICEGGRDFGFTTAIFSTNGFFCTKNRLEELPSGVNYVLCIDFCDDRKYFESYRGTPNSWQTVLSNILTAADTLSDITFRLTDISSFTIRDAKELAMRYEALKTRFAKYQSVTVGQRIFHNATGLIHIDGKPPSKIYHLCPYPWTSLVIASNGDVVACCRDLQHRTVLGNLLGESLQQIWNGDRMQAMRAALVMKLPETISACAGCDLPYDSAKFSAKHLVRTAVKRLNILGK
jgi:radical SAM protein with 4Fe4S-binding SPASM domain